MKKLLAVLGLVMIAFLMIFSVYTVGGITTSVKSVASNQTKNIKTKSEEPATSKPDKNANAKSDSSQKDSVDKDAAYTDESKTPPKEKPPVTITFNAMGDISLGAFYGNRIQFDTVYEKNGPSYFLKNLEPYLKDADFNTANLESVFTDSTDYLKGKIYSYKVRSKEYAKILSTNNIMYLNIVNNHMQDYKEKGLNESVDFLIKNGFKVFGTNLMPTTDPELGAVLVDRVQIFEKDGFKIGMLGFYAFNSTYATDDVIKERVEYLKSQGADFIFAHMHGGGQETHDVYQAQVTNAHRLVDNGVDLVLGAHPHALQKTEYYKGKKIYYSLGNFFFPNYRSSSFPETIMVRATLTKNPDGKVTTQYENIPVLWTGIYGGNNYQPAVIGSEKIKDKIRNILQDIDPVI